MEGAILGITLQEILDFIRKILVKYKEFFEKLGILVLPDATEPEE